MRDRLEVGGDFKRCAQRTWSLNSRNHDHVVTFKRIHEYYVQTNAGQREGKVGLITCKSIEHYRDFKIHDARPRRQRRLNKGVTSTPSSLCIQRLPEHFHAIRRRRDFAERRELFLIRLTSAQTLSLFLLKSLNKLKYQIRQSIHSNFS